MMTLWTFLLIVVVVGLVYLFIRGMGGAGADINWPPAKNKADVTEKDPICGMKVQRSSLTYKYQNKSYYFCSDPCRKVFADSPAEFVHH